MTFRRFLVDSGLTLLSVGYAVVVQAAVIDATPFSEMGAVEVASAVFATSSLWWLRRRSPEAFAFVAVLSGFLCDVTGALPPIALATIGLRGSWRRTVVATVLVTAAILVQVLLEPGPSPLRASVGTVVILVAVAGWATAVHNRRQVVAMLQEQVENASWEAARQGEDARRDERARIARDMHDTLTHRMSLLAIHGAALVQRAEEAPADVREIATSMRTTARDSLEDLRWVIDALRDARAEPSLRPTPGPADLPHLVEQAKSLGEEVALEVEPDLAALDSLSSPVGQVLFRVAQESLTNARKHGAGRPVRVEVLAQPGRRVDITVSDAGTGSHRPVVVLPGSGRGLVGLTERVRTVGGSIDHGPHEGGYRVYAQLPWTPARGGSL